MVQRNGARGVVDAKVHTPSGSSEECYVTELDSGTHRHDFVVQSRRQKAGGFGSVGIIYGKQISNSSTRVVFQTRTQSASFHGKMEFTP